MAASSAASLRGESNITAFGRSPMAFLAMISMQNFVSWILDPVASASPALQGEVSKP
jgi:hypothetical protein